MMARKYSVLYADPPWKYHQQRPGGMNNAADHYDVLSVEDIAALPVWEKLDKPGILFMWATSPMLKEAFDLGEHLGLTYRGVSFLWVKTNKQGVPYGAAGVRPTITKPLTEMVLAFSNVKRGRPLPVADESVVQTIFAPRREHSRKPDEVAQRIEMLYPGVTKLEVFARETREGWDAWGNEVGKFD